MLSIYICLNFGGIFFCLIRVTSAKFYCFPISVNYFICSVGFCIIVLNLKKHVQISLLGIFNGPIEL